jgi:replication factor C subunit 2/4
MTELWIEKYRPKSINDLVMDNNTLNKIKNIIEKREMPNIIITGAPGIGKTTTILCIARDLMGKYYKHGILELNASDDRGIKIVNESINYFCKKKLEVNDEDFGKYAKHKIIILDEADNMTKKAKQLINDLMGKYNNSTRFAFTCNDSSEIAESIQSKCIILRYSRLDAEQIKNRLIYICKNENVKYDDKGISCIANISQGDLRQAISKLQSIHSGYGEITEETIYMLNDIPHPIVIQNIFSMCKDKKIKEAIILFNELKEKGYSNSDISVNMLQTLKHMDNLDESIRIKFMEEVNKTCLNISKGVGTTLQLTGCIAALCK